MDSSNGTGSPKVIITKDTHSDFKMAAQAPNITASMMPQSIYYSLPPMPWFGMDIGGTLTKLVYFEPTDLNDIANGIKRNDLKTLSNIRRYLITNKAYGKSGHRDAHLQMSDIQIGGRQGTLHFIRFPTSQVRNLKIRKMFPKVSL